MSQLHYLQQQLDNLTVAELTELLTYLNEKMNRASHPKTPRKWSDMRGIAPNLLEGEDAQEWVSRLRGN